MLVKKNNTPLIRHQGSCFNVEIKQRKKRGLKQIRRDIDKTCKWRSVVNYWVGNWDYIRKGIVAVVDAEIVVVAPECVSFVPGNSCQ